jgi:predicted transcriptional regulator
MKLISKDYMSTDVRSLPPDMNAKEALRALMDSGMSGLPVLEKDGTIVGVFTEKEVLKAILPSYIKDVGAFVYGEGSKSELKKLAHMEGLSVKDLMRREFPTVSEETSLAEVSRIMLTKSERRVIVTSGCKAVGIITRSDVVKALAKEAGMKL